MAERLPLGSARLYSISAAVTCPYCGLPMFIVRPPKEGEQVDHTIRCAECGRLSRISVVVLEREMS
jgi:DNA-directed RNA polymerase subunit RPC12/RpoP